ncbi:hypothetical protein EST38_g8262 [Candolleomyces aberdarensis]|uniref:Uncharacterized protein n=1 Tax=Candolleomyces aberdarensis TaxID=2316362 RepID=A0A4Q2DDM6_9AGAR|nr:hypothetical protein EST38_g8262 [Candolleomyces aberdarensis]
MGSPTPEEVNGNLIALNSLAGIPLSALKGFRAPLLDFNADTLKTLHDSKFLYDSSATASIPVTDPNTDAYWPYTLDNGLANNCLTTPGVCRGEPKLPGLWEIPMYAFFDQRGVRGPHLMDPWLDSANGASSPSNNATLAYMQSTFTDHYNGNRQPIGLYTHPIHVSRTYPGVTVSQDTIDMINGFLDWAQERDNGACVRASAIDGWLAQPLNGFVVWIVSNEQLLDWVRNPVPASQLNTIPSFACPRPTIDASVKVCNGIPQNEGGLLARCGFSDFPFFTCYGCPTTVPTPQNPLPAQDPNQVRHRLPATCSTEYWDPIGNQCLCNSASCAFQDSSRPIGPNGFNFTGGGVGGDLPGVDSSTGTVDNGNVPTDDTLPGRNAANSIAEPFLGSGLLAFLVATLLSMI